MIKFKKKTKDVVESGKEIMKNPPSGIKIVGTYWTLGKFDAVWIYEAPSEKDAMKLSVMASEVMRFQTMTAVSRDDVMKLLDY
ncbi:GYD domain-containing protein [Nitrosopumilus piranensis]|nr:MULTISPECIES: GYD domain-containing protein [Nitrosopumilus]